MSDREDEAEDTEGWVPVEDRAESQSGETLDPFGGVNNEEEVDPLDDTEGDDDALYPWATGRGSTSGDAPWVGGEPPEEEFEPEYDVPGYVEMVGQSGVYLGVAALVLAIAGVSLASVNVQPFANMALVFSLAAILVAMFLGLVFQMYIKAGS